jgi:hypothetical protein
MCTRTARLQPIVTFPTHFTRISYPNTYMPPSYTTRGEITSPRPVSFGDFFAPVVPCLDWHFAIVAPCCPLVTEGALDRRPLPRLPAETRDLWPAITINAPAQGDFGWLANVERNAIFELSGTEPDFLMEFKTKLRQRRWIDSETVCFF